MKNSSLLEPKDSSANLYRTLLCKLTGKEMAFPRRKTPVNVWRKTQRAAIEAKVKVRAASTGTTKDHLVALHDKVARELYATLSDEAKTHWTKQANQEYEAAVTAWKSDPSTNPADRQLCIQRLVGFAQPFLDGLSERTGWQATLIIGGPEPARDGALDVVGVHSGVAIGDVKTNFGREAGYEKHIVSGFGSFLQNCYTTEECCRALSLEEGVRPLGANAFEEHGANLDLIDHPTAEHSSEVVCSDGVFDQNDVQEGLQTAGEPSSIVPSLGAVIKNDDRMDLLNHQRVASQVSTPERALSQTALQNNPPVDELPPPCSHGSSPLSSPSQSPSGLPSADGPSTFPTSDDSPAIETAVAQTRVATVASSALKATVAEPAVVAQGGTSYRIISRRFLASPYPAHVPVPTHSFRKDTLQELLDSELQAHPSATLNNGTFVSNSKPARGRKRGLEASASAFDQSIDAPPSKRLRAQGSGTASFAGEACAPSSSAAEPLTLGKITTPIDAPKWFENALSMFQSEELGASWTALLESWAAFEISENFTEVVKLTTAHRPACIKDWIQRTRSTTWRPSSTSIPKYEAAFTKWWTSLQPGWRLSEEGNIDFAAVGGEWKALRRPGVNGLLSVIAALFFWGLAVEKQNIGKAEWLAAVEDCHVACMHLLRLNDLN